MTPGGTSSPAVPTPWSTVVNLDGDVDQGAFGSKGKVTERRGTSPIVFMGARAYAPVCGRFLSTDPVGGGCANRYVYVFGDPINLSDLSGKGIGDWLSDRVDDAKDVGRGIGKFVSDHRCGIGQLLTVAATAASLAALLAVSPAGIAAWSIGSVALSIAGGALRGDALQVGDAILYGAGGMAVGRFFRPFVPGAVRRLGAWAMLGVGAAGIVPLARQAKNGGC